MDYSNNRKPNVNDIRDYRNLSTGNGGYDKIFTKGPTTWIGNDPITKSDLFGTYKGWEKVTVDRAGTTWIDGKPMVRRGPRVWIGDQELHRK